MNIKIRKKQEKTTKELQEKLDKLRDQKKQIFDHYEINILKENDIIESFDIEYNKTSFEHDNKKYNIDNKAVYLYPVENGYIPTFYYEKGKPNPLNMKNLNVGIPARALYLLWNHALYSVIVTFETDKTNKLIILLLIANAIIFCIKLYFTYKG